MKRLIILHILPCFFFSITSLLCNLSFAAQPSRCPFTNVYVYALKLRDVQYACEATTETLSFLMQSGLHIQDTFSIHLADEFDKLKRQKLYLGFYDHRIKEIHVLSYARCKGLCKEACFCGLKLSRELHTSFIVHEIAHALTIDLLEKNGGRIAASEYIAYTTQFSLMPDNLRHKILTEITNEGFSNETEITSLFHDLNPSVFAVKAYRHFIRPENGKIFYKKLISGKLVLDTED